MTKIALIADAHVANHKRWGGPMVGGLNHRGRECAATLARAVKLAAREGCESVVILGDLFDSTRPSPSVVYWTMRALKSAPGMGLHIILGNHDRQSQHEIDHACASAGMMPNVNVIAEPTIITSALGTINMVCVPYQPGLANDWLTSGLAALAPRINRTQGVTIVLTHLGIWDDSTPAFLKSTHDSVGLGYVRWLLDAHKLDALYAGNWHAGKTWRQDSGASSEVAIPGTICSHNFSDPSGFGSMLVYDSVTRSTHRILVPGPRFATLGIQEAEHIASLGTPPWAEESRMYLRIQVDRKDLSRALGTRDRLLGMGDVDPGIPHFVVQLDVRDRDARESVREAARSAVSAGDDLTGYADLAAVTEPGTRAGVEARLAAYRKEAG